MTEQTLATIADMGFKQRFYKSKTVFSTVMTIKEYLRIKFAKQSDNNDNSLFTVFGGSAYMYNKTADLLTRSDQRKFYAIGF